MAAVIVLSAIGLYVFYLWLDNQLYSDRALPLPVPELTNPPDIQSRLLNSGQIRLSGAEMAQLIWLDKPPEMDALAVDIVSSEEWGPAIRLQSSLNIGEDTTRPYLNIDVELGFKYENNQFSDTHIYRCRLGQLDLSRWCKSAELDNEFNERIESQTQTDPMLASTVSLIQSATIEDGALIVELRQEDLLRQVLDQLQNLDPALLDELQNLEFAPTGE